MFNNLVLFISISEVQDVDKDHDDEDHRQHVDNSTIT